MYAKYGKRTLDVALSLTGLVILLPSLLLIGLTLRLTQGRPVLFRQVRPGKNGEPFTMIKFRTMRVDRESDGRLLSDSERVTAFGDFLRSTSLDELPELWNVLRGDMSLVGPRPLLMEYLSRYTEAQARRHEVRPGITGLAQVSGRQLLPFSERLRKDVQYVDNVSLVADIRILAATIVNVIRRRDVVTGQDVNDVDDIGLTADLPE